MRKPNSSPESAVTRKAEGRLRIEAWRALDAAIKARADAYDRLRDLPRLLPLLPEELGSDAIIRYRLERALKRERALGRSGHWAYDPGRHFALRAAFDAETSRMPLHMATQTKGA